MRTDCRNRRYLPFCYLEVWLRIVDAPQEHCQWDQKDQQVPPGGRAPPLRGPFLFLLGIDLGPETSLFYGGICTGAVNGRPTAAGDVSSFDVEQVFFIAVG
jgi:hypothetical protein